MAEEMKAYVLRRISDLKNQGKRDFEIIEQLGPILDFGDYTRPELRQLLQENS